MDVYHSTLHRTIDIHDLTLDEEYQQYKTLLGSLHPVPGLSVELVEEKVKGMGQQDLVLTVTDGFFMFGISGDDAPFYTIRDMISVNPSDSITPFLDYHDEEAKMGLIGDAAYLFGNNAKISVQKGDIVDKDAFIAILHHILDRTGIKPSNHRIITNLAGLEYNTTNFLVGKILLDLGFKAIYVYHTIILDMFAKGIPLGIVLRLDYNFSEIAPLEGNILIPHAYWKLDIGTAYVLDQFALMMSNRGVHLNSLRDRICLEVVSNTLSKVQPEPVNYNQSGAYDSQPMVNFTRPNLETIEFQGEQILAPEMLFTKLEDSHFGKVNFVEKIYNVISSCNDDIRWGLYDNVILTGVLAGLSGLEERIRSEFGVYGPSTFRKRVFLHDKHRYSAWFGASLVSSSDHFEDFWLSQEEYREKGEEGLSRMNYGYIDPEFS